MMPLKTNNLRFTIKTIIALLAVQITSAQTVDEVTPAGVDTTAVMITEVVNDVKAKDTIKKIEKFKVDGVAGVVGDYLILESDIDQFLFDIKSQGQSAANITPCQVLGNLLESKLLAHQAIQDSIVISDSRLNSEVDQIIARFSQQLGSEQKVVEYYKKDNMSELRDELYRIQKDFVLSERMNSQIIESVDVTPDEVKSFFNRVKADDELPTIGVELEISQIVIEPKATEEAKQEVIERLKGFRRDVLENGSSFATKAVLYTEDGASRADGGLMVIDRRTPLVPEFRDVAFNLQPGEVSEPFATDYGYHIVTLDKIRGDKLEIRHILLIPEIGRSEEEEANDLIKKIRERIVSGELTFDAAAREFSDEKETKFEGGQLVNPNTLDKRFELNKLDPTLYTKVSDLENGEISLVFNDPGRIGNTRYKILTVRNKQEEHEADFVKDYIKIKELALREKQIEAIEKWQTEKIKETYIKINGANRDCEFVSNWLKK